MSDANLTFYDLLGISTDATPDEIQVRIAHNPARRKPVVATPKPQMQDHAAVAISHRATAAPSASATALIQINEGS